MRRVRDFAEVIADGIVTKRVADEALTQLEIDRTGLDAIDRRLLASIIRNYGGGPVGLDTIAATINEEPVTLEDVYEPFLMQQGFLTRSPRGGARHARHWRTSIWESLSRAYEQLSFYMEYSTCGRILSQADGYGSNHTRLWWKQKRKKRIEIAGRFVI